MGKSIGELDYIPEGVGFAVGVGDGIIVTKADGPHHRTAYRAVVGLGAFLARNHLPVDVSMGAMVAAATLAASAIPYALQSGSSATVFPAVVRHPVIAEPPPVLVEQPTRAGWYGRQQFTNTIPPSPGSRQVPTAAGFGVEQPSAAGWYGRQQFTNTIPPSPGSRQVPTRAGFTVERPTVAGYLDQPGGGWMGGDDPMPRLPDTGVQKPTRAG